MCSETGILPTETSLRVRVHRLRTCVELIGAHAFAQTVGASPRQAKIAPKLLTLLTIQPRRADEKRSLAAIRGAQNVYAKTSDVLHGRVSQLNLHEAAVIEWEEAVAVLLEIWPTMQQHAVCPDCRAPLAQLSHQSPNSS